MNRIFRFSKKQPELPNSSDLNQPPDDPFSGESKSLNHLLKNKPRLLAIIVFFILLFLVAINLIAKIKLNRLTPNSISLPTPVPLVAKVSTPSAYATDSAILKIESELIDLGKKMDGTNFNEPLLLPPKLDMKVRF